MEGCEWRGVNGCVPERPCTHHIPSRPRMLFICRESPVLTPSGIFNALVVYFTMDLGDDQIYSSGLDNNRTHWDQPVQQQQG